MWWEIKTDTYIPKNNKVVYVHYGRLHTAIDESSNVFKVQKQEVDIEAGSIWGSCREIGQSFWHSATYLDYTKDWATCEYNAIEASWIFPSNLKTIYLNW